MATTSFPRILPGAKTHFPLASGGHDVWHKSVPSAVSRAQEWGDESAGWKAWRDHLRKRTCPRPPAKVLKDASPFLWGLADRGPASTAGLHRRIEKLLAGKESRAELAEELRYWLADATSPRDSVQRALDSVCWCWNLPRLARRLPATLWWTLLNRLVETSANATQVGGEVDPVAQQILAGELALTLAYLLPELKACRKLAAPARQALTAGLETLVDDEGLLQGRHWSQLGLLLGSWTRSARLGAELRNGSWSESAQNRYNKLVVQALRAATPTGSTILGTTAEVAWPATFWSAVLASSTKPAAKKLASLVLPRRLLSDIAVAAEKSSTSVEPAAQSDTSGVALLRSHWSRRSDLLAVECSDSVVQTEFIANGDRLWSGTWEIDVQIAGANLVPVSPWESVCWVSDEDVVYFELERAFAGGVRIQRQMLLARDDRFLLLADTVLGRQPAPVSYRGSLPLAEVNSIEPAEETRELRLRGAHSSVLVVPCALNEWRQGTQAGSLEVRDRSLVLEQNANGGNLFAPIFIDLDPRRQEAPLTWRNLTVAADREIQPADVAVGYRVRVGKQQWLVYRAMAERRSRTVLGANTWTPFLVTRVKKTGELETLLEIE